MSEYLLGARSFRFPSLLCRTRFRCSYCVLPQLFQGMDVIYLYETLGDLFATRIYLSIRLCFFSLFQAISASTHLSHRKIPRHVHEGDWRLSLKYTLQILRSSLYSNLAPSIAERQTQPDHHRNRGHGNGVFTDDEVPLLPAT